MTPSRLGVQILIVLTLMVAVTWPELGQVRAVSVWRTDGPLVAARRRASEARPSGRGNGQFGVGSATYAGSVTGDPNGLYRRLYEDKVEGRRRRAIPEQVLALGGKLNAIIGRARTTLNAPLAGARLVLRNLETGAVEARATANEGGEFVFLDVMPSSYVVELVGPNGDVISTSESLIIDIGDLIQTTVRGANQGALQAMFGSVMQATAHEPISAASRDGVTQVTPPERCVSPPCTR